MCIIQAIVLIKLQATNYTKCSLLWVAKDNQVIKR